jgi:hypothetical protein
VPILIAGTAISGLMISRSQVDGDQLNMLARGWLLYRHRVWTHVGDPTSAGGDTPGPLTAVLVGLPLFVWQDYRAPAIVILLFHLAAFFVLDAMIKRICTGRERILFALFFWLNPWRLYFSGFLWDPNYLFLFGALHTWSTYVQRVRANFWASLVHVLAIGLAFELHASAVLLVIASVLLYMRGYLRLHWPGAFVGAGSVAASLVPWLGEVLANPAILPVHRGFPARGLLLLFPLLRGLAYWLRYASLSLSGNMVRLDFTPALGTLADRLLLWPAYALTFIVGPLTLAFPVIANYRLWRRGWRPLTRLPSAKTRPRTWLRGYVMWTFVAALLAFALSPTTIMMWQVLVVLHVAVLPLVFWLAALMRTRLARVAHRAVAVAALASGTLALAMSVAAPMYRCGGRHGVRIALLTGHPMLTELHVPATCSIRIDPVNGWWPDVLPLPPGLAPPGRHPGRVHPGEWRPPQTNRWHERNRYGRVGWRP